MKMHSPVMRLWTAVAVFLGGQQWGHAFDQSHISLHHFTQTGKYCDSGKSLGWAEPIPDRFRSEAKKLRVVVTDVEQTKPYKIEVLVERDDLMRPIAERIVKPENKRLTMDFSYKFAPIGYSKKPVTEKFSVRVTDEQSKTVVSKTGSLIRFKMGTSFFGADQNRGQRCVIATEAVPVSGILRNLEADNMKNISFSETPQTSESSGHTTGSSTLLGLNCSGMFADCQSLINISLISNLNSCTGPCSIGFGYETYTQRFNSSISFKEKIGPVFAQTWHLRPLEAGIIYKQYQIIRYPVPYYDIDQCGDPTQGRIREAEDIVWSYNLVIVDETRLTDAKYLKERVHKTFPVVNSCKR